MASVTDRIKEIEQPYAGYLKVRNFQKTQFSDGNTINKYESIQPYLTGLAVDYLTRFVMGTSKEEAFKISLMGAKSEGQYFIAYSMLDKISGLNFESICNACKLVSYDTCYREGPRHFIPPNEIFVDKETAKNIEIMVRRCVTFWDINGPIIKDGFTFDGGYTRIITAGDGDVLTKDTLWDIKTSRKEIDSKNTLQLLVYYLMGKHSNHTEFQSIDKIGIFNPRLNKSYVLETSKISPQILDDVSHYVIGYGITQYELSNYLNEKRQHSQNKPQKLPIFNDDAYENNNHKNDILNPEIFGTNKPTGFISKAFPPTRPLSDHTIFERQPIFWEGNFIPSDILEKKKFFIIRFKACFSVKQDKTPFLKSSSLLYIQKDPLSTSDIYDARNNTYHKYYQGPDGKNTLAMPVLTLTSDDFELFKESYNISKIEIISGCYFK